MQQTRLFGALVGLTVTATLLGDSAARVVDPPMDVVVLNDNGAWSWFQDERAVFDPRNGSLLVSSVASSAGTDGLARGGSVEVVQLDTSDGSIERTVLHANLQSDDHDAAALHVRPDGRYVAMYSQHATDSRTRWRLSAPNRDSLRWEPEQAIDLGAPVTYSNIYPSAGPGGADLYAFVRAAGLDPAILVSHNDGDTWEQRGRLFDGPGRPYVRYAAAGDGRIHLLTTEQHPHAYTNGVYHGIIESGRLQRADGTVVDPDISDTEAVTPATLTPVHPRNGTDRAWTIDLQVSGHEAYAAYSIHAPGSAPSPHSYYYARNDGTHWRSSFLAHAGTPLYAGQPYYTGLVALHPNDPNYVVVSTNADPSTGEPLISLSDGRRHHELFEGRTTDRGATWTWTSLTTASTVDNIRPIIVTGHHHTAVLWLRGHYHTYTDYDLDVVVTLRPPQPADQPANADIPRPEAAAAPESQAAWTSARLDGAVVGARPPRQTWH